MGKVTTVWLSSTVVKVRFLIHGTGVLRGTTMLSGENVAHTNTKDISLHSNTHTKRCDIQQQKAFSLRATGMVGQDSGLDGGAVRNTLIRIDALVQSTSVKDIRHQFLDLGDTSGSTDQDNIIDILLVNLCVFEDRFNGCNCRLESFVIDGFKSRPSNR